MRRPRTHGTGTKRDAILEAAVELLLAKGFGGTSMDAVAAKAGVSKTTVYAHFADKDKLFRAVMAHASSMLVPNVSEAISGEVSDPVERLVRALTAVVESAIAPELIAFFRVLIAEHERRGQLAGALEEARTETGLPDVISVLEPFLQAVADERGVELVAAHHWVVLLLRLAGPTFQLDMLTSDFEPSDEIVGLHVRLVVDLVVQGALVPGGRAELPVGYDAYPWSPAFER
ncbi:TetR/AcrR family transcriptional regulator [Herbiconiux sp.]|uniref:TetR/AcrR family transcriptional regulator n=1 Tax=Herbiconiux sp. TaxID=1871186 RepID=UPI0025B98489|nr:TetR/AcrR family transcriptional regulator [Herbiconiux sp.]